MTQMVVLSARIRALVDAADLEAFWAEVGRDGAPLVEDLHEAGRLLVTFVFRGDPQTRQVAVVAGPAGFALQDNQLQRHADSDLWFRSYRVDADTRCFYQLAVNGPQVSPWQSKDLTALTASWHPDPRNPRRYAVIEEEGSRHEVSILELPGAPSMPWSRVDDTVPRGRLERQVLNSAVMQQARPLVTYRSNPCFGAPQNLLVVLDGVAFTQTVATPAILDNLIAAGRIPPVFAVFVDTLGAQRNRDLVCDERFAQFLAVELVPWVEQRCARFAPARTVLAGASFGGVCSAFAAFRFPERFGNVLSMSGSYWVNAPGDRRWEELPRLFEGSERLPLRFHQSVGKLEAGNRIFESAPCQLASNRRMHEILCARGYPVTYVEYAGGHDFICWEQVLPEGLMALLAP